MSCQCQAVFQIPVFCHCWISGFWFSVFPVTFTLTLLHVFVPSPVCSSETPICNLQSMSVLTQTFPENSVAYIYYLFSAPWWLISALQTVEGIGILHPIWPPSCCNARVFLTKGNRKDSMFTLSHISKWIFTALKWLLNSCIIYFVANLSWKRTSKS